MSKRICVVGGSSGIGLAVVERCLQRGDRVVSIARRDVPLTHERLRSLRADITKDASLAQAKNAFGGLDALLFSAGVVHKQLPGEISDHALKEQIDLNFIAALRVGEAALRDLEEGGAMLFISSTLAHRPIVDSAVYSATKAAMHAMTKSLALAGAKRRIRVNTISPGLVATAMTKGRDTGALPVGEPEDVAQAILALIDQPWMTGTDVVLDGGLLLRE